ncbi:hypothetical protein C0992_007269 [Termitomyces sp. T32_za158]|nr:hypothetical protein C0992_007269 [Termitomyces sp. T32_za158]
MPTPSGNINGAVSSNVYRAPDAPWYPLGEAQLYRSRIVRLTMAGHGLVLMYIGIGIIFTLIYHFFLVKENARRDRGERDEIIGKDGTGNEKNGRFATLEEAKVEKGDEWSGYRYMT